MSVFHCFACQAPAAGERSTAKEMFQFRKLLWFLTVREIKIRYKQPRWGVAWAGETQFIARQLRHLCPRCAFFVNFGATARNRPLDGQVRCRDRPAYAGGPDLHQRAAWLHLNFSINSESLAGAATWAFPSPS